MSDELITITLDDISQANRLSLGCPICGSPVEKDVTEAALRPVACTRCDTLYHRYCWDQNGGQCAILGCGHKECRPYGAHGSVVKITADDLPTEEEVRRRKAAERASSRSAEKQRAAEKSPGFWQRLFSRIREAFN